MARGTTNGRVDPGLPYVYRNPETLFRILCPRSQGLPALNGNLCPCQHMHPHDIVSVPKENHTEAE